MIIHVLLFSFAVCVCFMETAPALSEPFLAYIRTMQMHIGHQGAPQLPQLRRTKMNSLSVSCVYYYLLYALKYS